MAGKDFQDITFRAVTIAVSILLVITFYIIFAANSATLGAGNTEATPSFMIAMILIIIEITLLTIYGSIRNMEHALEK